MLQISILIIASLNELRSAGVNREPWKQLSEMEVSSAGDSLRANRGHKIKLGRLEKRADVGFVVFSPSSGQYGILIQSSHRIQQSAEVLTQMSSTGRGSRPWCRGRWREYEEEAASLEFFPETLPLAVLW